jgi:hypothetical protein
MDYKGIAETIVQGIYSQKNGEDTCIVCVSIGKMGVLGS